MEARDAGAQTRTLLQRYLEGDPDAFDAIVEQYGPMLRVAALRRGCRRSELDDVVQETWLSLLRHAGAIRTPGALGSWLWITASNHALRIALHGDRSEPTDFAEDPVTVSLDTDLFDEVARSMDGESFHDALDAALAHLSARDRRLVELLFRPGDSPDYRTISRLLGIPTGAIGPTRGRIMVKLRRDPQLSAAYHALAA